MTVAPVPSSEPGGLHWQRLHPLTPIVAAGRIVAVLLVVAAEGSVGRRAGNTTEVVDLALLAAVLVASVVRWLVTRWALDGVTLRIETGLIRRDARQLPLVRIQAVDVARPFLARLVGLAELRVRLAGAGRSSGRLSYLSEAVALDLRARLLAGHHGLDLATPEPAEQPLATVATGQLVAAALLSPAAFIVPLLIAAIVVVSATAPAAAAAGVSGTLVAYLIGFARLTWRRVVDQYGFSVGQAPDGIRIRRGLLSTIAETVPVARVQAVRKVEPLLWRPLRWCRLEVDVAGSPGREQGTRSGKVTKALLPVGPRGAADGFFYSLLGMEAVGLVPPPARARWKTPLSYHFLSSGLGHNIVAASTGRLRKVTTWVPFIKIQSVRRVQGPLQRALGLATVHVDAAGRRVRAELRDRSVPEADRLFEQLVLASRAARRRASPGGLPSGTELQPTLTGQPPPPPQ